MTTLRPPRALLLDHGGVLMRSVKHPERTAAFAARVHALIGPSAGLGRDCVLSDIEAGKAAYRTWKNGHARTPAPREIGHRELWEDFIAADWPPAARALVGAEATWLCRELILAESDKTVAPGMLETLRLAREHGVRTGIVSNTLVGSLNRDLARRFGTHPLLDVQVYSDETGRRKPDPEMIHLAARALSVDPADCWYVGDNYDRDVVCGMRAGAGATILMRPAERRDPKARPQPDAEVADGGELLDLLRAALAHHDAGRTAGQEAAA
ncbi:HAD family hydrolase [Streptomyces sp. A1277]|uniref:HAD family hydrolase n=1 Tax=Streptomyces sp. A1277 TaxID=2563103 RepID=UPI0010A2453D|nr:HAD family hydrolase [Streptomyces sp. A1277]THA33407.1 HAD family hydrolase [Streptomyces sp. A1277]